MKLASDTADREIVLSRVLDAPRELVWKVWTEEQHLARWWGPQGFTTTTHSRHCVAGGKWRFVMHGPDGRDYENLITFLEVVPPERLSYKHGGDVECEPVNFQVTVTFEIVTECPQQTRLTMHSVFPSQRARDFVIENYNALEGGKQTLGRLADYLATQLKEAASDDETFVYTRVVHAPPELVWKMWTEQEHLARWMGPKGVEMETCSLDLRKGGLFLYSLRTSDGGELWGRWVFREIIPTWYLETLFSFSDQSGGIAQSPFDPNWPRETLSILTLAPHAGIGRGTVVTLKWSVYNGNDDERRTFAAGHSSMQQGWTGTFEKLEAYLDSMNPKNSAET